MTEGGSKLSEEVIYESLRSLNVPVRMNDLKVPTRDFIIRVFECFLKDLQIDITSHVLRTWEATNHIEDADIYEETQSLVLLAMSVNHVCSPCGINITLKDILEPKPKRTKKILNYILVFWNYYLRKYARFRVIEESYECDKKKAEDLVLENESLDEKYNEMVNTLENMKANADLSSIVKEKEKKNNSLQAQSDILKADYQDLKTKEVNIQSQMGALDVQLITAKERLQELSQLILSSPERINTEIKNIEDKIKAEDAKIKEGESRYKEVMKKVKLQEESLKEEEEFLMFLTETMEITNYLRNTGNSIVEKNQKLSELEDKLKRIKMDLERQEEGIFQQKQKSAKVVLNKKKQVETLKNMYEMLEGDEAKLKKGIQFLKTANNNLQLEIDAESDKILDVIDKCKTADAKTKEREAEFYTEAKQILTAFESDCKEVGDMSKSVFQNKSSK